MSEPFQWPAFYAYPPYFTLQPIKETRAKQSALWRDLILAYCKHEKIFVLSTTDDGPLFANKEINRRLPVEARAAFLADAVAAGQAAWIDSPANTGTETTTTTRTAAAAAAAAAGTAGTPKRALIFWRPLPEWGELLLAWARDSGLSGGAATVLTLDELDSGDGDAAGCPLSGTHRELVRAAAKWLAETKRAVALFGGGGGGNDASEGEDVGVKFL